jgi:alpha-methylacyl-CoA racemase
LSRARRSSKSTASPSPPAPSPPSLPGDHTHALLRGMGFDAEAITALEDGGVVAQSSSH